MRVLSLFWVMGFHFFYMMGLFLEPEVLKFYIQTPYFSWMSLGRFSVDIFFVLSGYLIGKILLTEFLRDGRISLKTFYLKRFFRIIPLYYFLMIVLLLLSYIRGENPFLPLKYFWSNFILLNNYIPYKEQYFAWAWTLAIEEHFYIIAPLVLGVMFKWKSSRFYIIAGLVILSAVLIRYFIIKNSGQDLKLIIHPSFGESEYYQYFDTLYAKTHTRFASLLMGVMVAYAQFATKLFSWFERRPWQAFLLLFFLPLLSACFIIAGMDFFLPHYNTWFVASFRYLYAILISLMMMYFLLEKSRQVFFVAKPVKHVFYVFSQLSYSAYLIHILIFYHCFNNYFSANFSVAEYYGFFTLLILISFILSFFTYSFIELPFLRLRQHLVSKG